MGKTSIFASDVVLRFQVEMDEASLAGLQKQPRIYVPATVREGNKAWHQVFVRVKGNRGSFQPIESRPSLTLKFDRERRGQNFHGLAKVHLNNSFQDPTCLNELLGNEVFRAAGVPAARVTHAVVTLNGRNLGLYVLVEGFDKRFLQEHFADTTGNLYDGGSMSDITQPLERKRGDGPEERKDLNELVTAATQAVPQQRFDKLGESLDVDQFSSFLAVEVMACSWDGYFARHNNYWLYRNPITRRFVFLPHGLDQMFGQPRSSLLPDCAGLAAAAFLSAPAGREQYRKRCTELLTNVFTMEHCNRLIDEAERRLRPALAELGPEHIQGHERAVRQLRERISQRIEHLKTELLAPYSPVTFDTGGEAVLSAGWLPQLDHGMAELTVTNQSMQIKCLGHHVPTFASWRMHSELPKGRYQLQGRIRCANLRPVPNFPVATIGLYGGPAERLMSMPPESEWRQLRVDFTVDDFKEAVDFVCELRAFSGTVTFDSMRLTRFSKDN